jgi:hypothetical protein
VKHLNSKLYYRQLHLKYWCNLARYWLQAVWGWHDSVETCRSVIICEIIVHLLVIAQNSKQPIIYFLLIWEQLNTFSLRNLATENFAIFRRRIQNFAIFRRRIQNFAIFRRLIQNFAIFRRRIQNFAIFRKRIQNFAIFRRRIQNFATFRRRIQNFWLHKNNGELYTKNCVNLSSVIRRILITSNMLGRNAYWDQNTVVFHVQYFFFNKISMLINRKWASTL